jgi:hypothetical protein
LRTPRNTPYPIAKSFDPRSCFWLLPASITSTFLNSLMFRGGSSQSGENASTMKAWKVSMTDRGAEDRAVFPPQNIAEIKSLACELPRSLGLPFSRLSMSAIVCEAELRGIVAAISLTTVWRYLTTDAIKPWMHRSWLFPRDPFFAEKATLVLDLYFRIFDGIPLGPKDFVISSDEKTSIQARHRKAIGIGPMPHKTRRVEFEYERMGAWAYLAAWDVHRAKLFGICEKTTGTEPYHKIVDLVMQQEPYRSADRVFWITDNGSSHRGDSSIQRLSKWYPNAIQIHTPTHASWLNQIEIFWFLAIVCG